MANRVVCYEIPIEYGDHVLYLISANNHTVVDLYLKRRFKLTVQHLTDKEPGSYFVAFENQLFIYFPPGLDLEYLVHEIIHVYKYIIERLGTKPDEEGEAYLVQMLFKKTVKKLMEVNQLVISYPG